ncbi:unnamed protein product [Pieris macdunnoughi]|nr:unnamed protein product [Pieris macdunnoughi]
MYGLTKTEILSLAYTLAEKNKIKHPFSSKREKAGIEWLKGFRKRHPDITLRAPESTSAARARAFNKPVVDKFFSILKDTQAKHSFPPYRIFNVDETSLCTVPTKNTKVFAQTGRKQVARVTSAERGDTTTAVVCGSATGNFIPPMFIAYFLQAMPRNYIRKTTRQNWSETSMQSALDAVKDGMAFKTASRQFSVPLMALKRRTKGKNKLAMGAVKVLGSKQTVFTTEQEAELVKHIKDMEIRMYGLTKTEILSLAYQLAEKNKIKHPFSSKREKAGIEWLKGFRKRHPDITLRAPESTSAARARAFNKPVVDKFFRF